MCTLACMLLCHSLLLQTGQAWVNRCAPNWPGSHWYRQLVQARKGNVMDGDLKTHLNGWKCQKTNAVGPDSDSWHTCRPFRGLEPRSRPLPLYVCFIIWLRYDNFASLGTSRMNSTRYWIKGKFGHGLKYSDVLPYKTCSSLYAVTLGLHLI